MTDLFRDMVELHRAGDDVGVYAVCSAHPLVLEAALRQSLEDGTWLLIEATSNQVDQFGGYSGMTPAGFRDFVLDLAASTGFPLERLVLGGDHLGPNRWRAEGGRDAMAKARDLVAAYVEAGFTKIHLDCSMPCTGDALPLTDDVIAARAADLAKAAEAVARASGMSSRISYVIGSEVPPPGGHPEALRDLTPTTPEAARATLEAHRAAFEHAGVAHAWPQVRALVVQPAVEFDQNSVIDYRSSATKPLQEMLERQPGLVFEAHSTDYQTTASLRSLVRDHWAVIKVGPGLTFALREGLFALARIEGEIVSASLRSSLVSVIDRVMVDEPGYWASYYPGNANQQRLARTYSYSDRIRYYWPHPDVQNAVVRLLRNLETAGIPETLLSQYLPRQFDRVRTGELLNTPHELLIDRIRDALRPYSEACAPERAAMKEASHV